MLNQRVVWPVGYTADTGNMFIFDNFRSQADKPVHFLLSSVFVVGKSGAFNSNIFHWVAKCNP